MERTQSMEALPSSIDEQGYIHTDRLTLRKWTRKDAESLFRWAQDTELAYNCGFLPHRSIGESARIIREVLRADENYAIVIDGGEQEDEAVGSIGLKLGQDYDGDPRSLEYEVGYWIARPFWGQGYVPEALRALIRHAFVDLGASAVWAGYYTGNERSRRAAEKAGLRGDHTERIRHGVTGARIDKNMMVLTLDEWITAQKADPTSKSYVDAQQLEARQMTLRVPKIAYIRSGGQSGADRGALDAALACGTEICGWCPPGGLAEDMPEAPGLLAKYPQLKESPANGYVERTALNVRDSHATLIIAPGGLEPKSGTEMTVKFAKDYERPYIVVDGVEDMDYIVDWISELGRGLTVNVAGPRESKLPGIHSIAFSIIEALLKSDI